MVDDKNAMPVMSILFAKSVWHYLRTLLTDICQLCPYILIRAGIASRLAPRQISCTGNKLFRCRIMAPAIGSMEMNPAREDVFFCTDDMDLASTFLGMMQLQIIATIIK